MAEPRVVEYEHYHHASDLFRAPEQTANGCCYGAAVYDGEKCTCWEPILEPVPTPEVQEGPMPVNTRRCGDCAYRRDSPERAQRDGDTMPYIPGGVFLCHVGMPRAVAYEHPCGERRETPPGTRYDDYRPIERGDRAWQADGRPAVVCAGWAADDRAYQTAQQIRGDSTNHDRKRSSAEAAPHG
ncbi:hypothetical protein ACXYX3_17820 [Mycobacterium sp. C3-094]